MAERSRRGRQGWQERQGKEQATATDETETGGAEQAGQGPAKNSVAATNRPRAAVGVSSRLPAARLGETGVGQCAVGRHRQPCGAPSLEPNRCETGRPTPEDGASSQSRCRRRGRAPHRHLRSSSSHPSVVRSGAAAGWTSMPGLPPTMAEMLPDSGMVTIATGERCVALIRVEAVNVEPPGQARTSSSCSSTIGPKTFTRVRRAVVQACPRVRARPSVPPAARAGLARRPSRGARSGESESLRCRASPWAGPRRL